LERKGVHIVKFGSQIAQVDSNIQKAIYGGKMAFCSQWVETHKIIYYKEN
jgi:hypothetical protein